MIRGLALLCALACSAAFASPWSLQEYRTPTYTLIMDSELPAPMLIQQLIEIDRVLDQVVPHNAIGANLPVTILVLPAKRWKKYVPFDRYTPVLLPLRFSSWLLLCGWDKTTWLSEDAYSEYTRMYLREKYPGRYPYWYERGLTYFMYYASIARDTAIIGANPFLGFKRWGTYALSPLKPVRDRIRINTEAALRVEPWSPDYADLTDKTPLDYQFWALVHRSLFEPEFAARTVSYLEQIDRLQPIGNAIKIGFGVSPAQLDAEMELYERRTNFKTIRVSFERVPAAQPIALRTLSEGEGLALLATVMADGELYADHWQQLASAAEKLGAPVASLESLALHVSSRDQDSRALEKALSAVAPRLGDPAVAREAGLALAERLQVYNPSGETPSELMPWRAKAFELLGRALQAHPQDIEAASAYALLASQLNRELDSASAILAATRQLMPRSPDAAYAAAVLAESRSDQAAALSNVRIVARFSRMQDQRRWAELRLEKNSSVMK